MQNNIFGTKHIGKIRASCSQSQRVAGVLTLHDSLQLRRDAIEHVHPSCSESPTVAARRKGITHQAIHCNWPVADNRVASLGVS